MRRDALTAEIDIDETAALNLGDGAIGRPIFGSPGGMLPEHGCGVIVGVGVMLPFESVSAVVALA